MEELLVRLKPLHERKGHKLQVYMYEGMRFQVERGWYRVARSLAEKLRALHQEHYDDESPLAFDVCTEEEALKLEEKERREAVNQRATVSQAANAQRVSPRLGEGGGGDMTTSDLKPASTDMLDGADEDDDDTSDPEDGRLQEVGRVSQDRTFQGGKKSHKVRTKK